MQITQTFSHVRSFTVFFFFRRDIWLYSYLVLIALYSLTFIGSFIFLFLGLRDFVSGGAGIVQSDFLFPPISSLSAVNIGLGLLGVSALASFATVYCSARAAATFGTGLVFAFQDVWDSLQSRQKRQILNTARFATSYARLIMMSLVPLTVFVLGTIYVLTFNIFMGIAVLLLGVVAIFAFIPANMISRRVEAYDFDPDVDAATLEASRSNVLGYLVQKLDMFVARRFISSSNVFILFLALLAGFSYFGPEGLVAIFNENAVVVIILVRASILSMTRVTLCLKVANKKNEFIEDVIRIKRDRSLPVSGSDGAQSAFDDDDAT